MPSRPLLILLLCLLIVPHGTGLAQDDPAAEIIHKKFEGIKIKGRINVGTCQLSSLYIMPELYKRRAYRPIWVKPQAVGELVAAIKETYRDGLDPADYHLEEIERMLTAQPGAQSPDPAVVASRDLILTDAFIRLANHSTCGKEDPLTFHPQWNLDRTVAGSDVVTYIEKGIEAPSIVQVVNDWKIHHPYYERLKEALARYRALRLSGGWKTVPDGPVLQMGMVGERVNALRERLAVTDNQLGATANPNRFDEDLKQAVMRFQKRHGLNQDGVVGKGTYAELNVPIADRIDQIRVNLERARWVLGDLGDTYVLVDIAGFRVIFQKHNSIVWSSRAQVGRPYRDTPVFKSNITYIELNPTWTIPPTILEKDVLPALRKDHRYLAKKNMVIVDDQDMKVNPATIDWSVYSARTFPYKLRQNAGQGNPWAVFKIVFSNPYLVYLHETPSTTLFEQEQRTFSSGCIRVEKPFELAELLMDNPTRWSIADLREAADTGKTQKIALPRPVPILLLYWTVEVDDEGRVYFKKDPYNRDPEVLKGLGRDAEITPVVYNRQP